jgi:hypothetical protein
MGYTEDTTNFFGDTLRVVRWDMVRSGLEVSRNQEIIIAKLTTLVSEVLHEFLGNLTSRERKGGMTLHPPPDTLAKH